MVCRADLAVEFPLFILWELIHRWSLCEMSWGVGGKGIMHRSAVRWGQDHGPELLQSLFDIIKVEERRKFQFRLAAHCSKLWTNTWGEKKLKIK